MIFISSSDANVSSTLLIEKFKNFIRIPYLFGVRYSDCVICQTKHQKNLLKKSIGKNGIIIKTIFTLKDYSINKSSKKTILWVGRIFRGKSPELYLKLAEQLPQYDFKMIGGSIL